MRVERVAGRFRFCGSVESLERLSGGHIHDSYVVGAGGLRYMLQRINGAIFRDPEGLMRNVVRVTEHTRRKLFERGECEIERRVLRVIEADDGRSLVRDEDGGWWRAYAFIERAVSREAVSGPADAHSAGRAFGAFQRLLADLGGDRLVETIPDFHNTPSRYSALERAVRTDAAERAGRAAGLIEFAMGRRVSAGLLADLLSHGHVPERVAHNDAKLDNVLLDADSGEALCVVDLDTVMPGLSLHDFGDMMRTMTCPAAEDERDLERVVVDPVLFEALADGYLSEAGAFLTPAERANLLNAGWVITLEQGVRFLTDHLNGDVYYKTRRPGHNFDRAAAQFALVASIEARRPELSKRID